MGGEDAEAGEKSPCSFFLPTSARDNQRRIWANLWKGVGWDLPGEWGHPRRHRENEFRKIRQFLQEFAEQHPIRQFLLRLEFESHQKQRAVMSQ